MTQKNDYQISWCLDAGDIESMISFFMENVSPSYISYSEIQYGRAIDPMTWNPKLDENLRNEFADIIKNHKVIGDGRRIAVLKIDGHLAGLAVIGFNLSAPNPFIIIEDLVVAKNKRKMGLGKHLLEWIEIKSSPGKNFDIFLESGIYNHDAHTFFQEHGFNVVSKVMLKRANRPETNIK